MKKVLSLFVVLLVMVVVSIPVATFAEEETVGVDQSEVENVEAVEDTEVVEIIIDTLTLEKAYELIEKYNKELKLMNDNINIYEKQYKDAVGRSDWARGKSIGGDEDQNVTYRKEELLYPKQRLLDLETAKHNREEKLHELKSSTKEQFLQIGVYEQELTNIQQELVALDNTIAYTETQINSGSLAPSALKPYAAQRVQFLSQIDTTQRQMNLGLMNLARNLGVTLSADVELEQLDEELVLFDDADIANLISQALATSYEYLSQEGQLELAQIEYDIIRNNTYVDNRLNELQQLEAGVMTNQEKLDQVKPNREATLWNQYYELKNLEGDLEIAKIDLEEAEYALKISQGKEALGTEKASTVVDDKIALNQQKVKLQQAINSYSLAVDELIYQLGQEGLQ